MKPDQSKFKTWDPIPCLLLVWTHKLESNILLKKRTLTEQTPSSSSMFSDSSPFYWLKCQPWCNCQQFVPSPPGISAKRQGQGRESMNPMIINSSSQLVRIWCSRLSRLNCPNVPSTETFRNQINQALTKSCQIWASRHRRMRKWFGSWSQRCSHPDRNFRKFLIPIFSLQQLASILLLYKAAMLSEKQLEHLEIGMCTISTAFFGAAAKM